ncbi:hypothetical protein FXO38_08479 [Capsicum annuum]|nr:hypothetical protein FXO38_08479 [Capsicum annuum]
MANLSKTPPNLNFSNFDDIFLSETSDEASSHSIQLTVSNKCIASSSMSSSNKRRDSSLESLPPEDMHKFWTLFHKEKFLTFKNHYIISGRVINLSLLKESHCNIEYFLKSQDMSMMLHLYGLEIFEDSIHIFFANLRLYPDSGELETLVLGTRLALNDFLFEKVFDTKLSGIILFVNNTWPKNFDVSFDKAKKAVSDPESNSLTFSPLLLSFCNRILAHIVATTFIPQKGSLSNVTYRDVFFLYCLIKKYKIN